MVENFGDKIFIKIIDKRNAFATMILKESPADKWTFKKR